MALGKKTGGRKKGSRNKRTAARAEAVAEVAQTIAAQVAGAFEGDAHALLMAVYKDPAIELELRIDCAKAAIRYEKPSLAAIEHTGKDGKPIEVEEVVTELELARRIAFLLTAPDAAKAKD